MTNADPKTQSKKPLWIRWPAVCLLVTLLAMDVAQTGWTMPAAAGKPGTFLPASIGHVESFHRGTNGKTLFYIEDAHSSLDAQVHIARIIQHLVKKQRVKTVFEEGYDGPVPTQWFRDAIPDEAKRKKAAWYLMDRLRLGGAEYAHIIRGYEAKEKREKGKDKIEKKETTSSENAFPFSINHFPFTSNKVDFKLIGADDEKLHQKNIQLYRKAVAASAQTTEDLNSLKSELDSMAVSGFSKPFKTWMGMHERFHAGSLDLAQYLARSQALAALSGKTLPENIFPQITLLLTAVSRQSVPDIDARKLYQEIESLETWMAENFLAAENRPVWSYLLKIRLLEELNSLTLASPEFEALLKAMPELGQNAGDLTREIGEFIFSKTSRPLVLSCVWEKNMKFAREFYRTVEARDQVLTARLARFSKQKDESSAALVFGGFHKRAILQILEEQGWSYAVIEPRIHAVSARHENYYRELMTEGHLRGETVQRTDQWVTQERLFNLAKSPGTLSHYLALNLPKEIRPNLREVPSHRVSKPKAVLSRSEVRGTGDDQVKTPDPWEELIRIGDKNAQFMTLLARKAEVPTGILYSLARTARLLKVEFQQIQGLLPDFNPKVFAETLQRQIAQLENEDERLVKEIELKYEMSLGRANLWLASAAIAVIFLGWVGSSALLGILSLAISISFPILRNLKIKRALLPRLMLPKLTVENTAESELDLLESVLADFLNAETSLELTSTQGLRSLSHGLNWFEARLEGLDMESGLLRLSNDELNRIMELRMLLFNLEHRVENVLRLRTRRLVMFAGIAAALAIVNPLMRFFPAGGSFVGLVFVFLIMRLFDLYERRVISQSEYPQAIQAVLKNSAQIEGNFPENRSPFRSEVRSIDFQSPNNIDQFLMKNVEVMNPEELVKNIYRMATHPHITTDHASFLLDVIHPQSARAYIGYGPHGSLILPSEYPYTVVRLGPWKTKDPQAVQLARAWDARVLGVLNGLRLSSRKARYWQRRLSFLRIEMPVDALAEEARRLFFRGHFKITGAAPDKSKKPAARLAIKPPYAYEEKYADMIQKGIMTPLEFEQALYGDLIKAVEFLMAGGLPAQTPLSLEEFSHLPVIRVFFSHYLEVSKDGQSFETTLSEFVKKMPLNLIDLQPGDPSRSEVRSFHEEAAAVEAAADYLKQKKWKLPGNTLVYPAAGTDVKTVMTFLDARPELTRAVLIDPGYQQDPLGSLYRLEIARMLTQMPHVKISQDFLEQLVDGDFDRVSRKLEIDLLIFPRWYEVWKNVRTVQLVLYAEDYLRWGKASEEAAQGFALTIVKNPDIGAKLTLDQLSGRYFYQKASLETAMQGVVYVSKAYAPRESLREEFALEWMKAQEGSDPFWKKDGEEDIRIEDGKFWLLRKNQFKSAASFLSHLHALDYDAIEVKQWKPYLEEMAETLNAGRFSFLHHFHSYYWLAEIAMAGILVFVDVVHALIQAAAAAFPLMSKGIRQGLYRMLEQRQFQQDVRVFHQKHSIAVKERIVRFLLSRLADEEEEVVRYSALRALLAAGTDSPAILEGLRLLRDERVLVMDDDILELLNQSPFGDLLAIREALYQDYAKRQAERDGSRSELRSMPQQPGSDNKAEALVLSGYTLEFPAKVLKEWLRGRTDFYAEPLRQAPSVLRLHLDRQQWEEAASRFVSSGINLKARRERQLRIYPAVFASSLTENDRITFGADLRKTAPFIMPGKVTLTRVNADTLDIHFSEAKRSEVRKPLQDQKTFSPMHPAARWVERQALHVLILAAAGAVYFGAESLWKFAADSPLAGLQSLQRFLLWTAASSTIAFVIFVIAEFLNFFIEFWSAWRARSLTLKADYQTLRTSLFRRRLVFSSVAGLSFSLIPAIRAWQMEWASSGHWQQALTKSGNAVVRYFTVGFLFSFSITLFFMLLKKRNFTTEPLSDEENGSALRRDTPQVEMLEFLPVVIRAGKEGWSILSTGKEHSPQVSYKVENGAYLRVLIAGKEISKPYELPAGETSESVVVGLGLQWQPLTGRDENWVVKFEWLPSVREIRPVQIMAIRQPRKPPQSVKGVEAVRCFSLDRSEDGQSLLRFFQAGDHFPEDFESFTHWWKQKRFTQGAFPGLEKEILGSEFIQLEFQKGETLQMRAETQTEASVIWTFPSQNKTLGGALSIAWQQNGHAHFELYDAAGSVVVQYDTRILKKPGAPRLLTAIGFDKGHLRLVFGAAEESLRGFVPDAILQELEKRGLTLESRLRFQGVYNRSEVRAPPAIIPGLLKSKRSKVKGLTIGEAAKVIGVTWRGLDQHIKHHPELALEYELDLTPIKPGRSSPIPKLLEKSKNRLKGKTLYQAAIIMKIGLYPLQRYFEKHPKLFEEYQVLPQTTAEKKVPQLLEENKRKVRGKNFTAIAEIVNKDLSTISRHFEKHPADVERYGVAKSIPRRKPPGRPRASKKRGGSKRSEVRAEQPDPKRNIGLVTGGLDLLDHLQGAERWVKQSGLKTITEVLTEKGISLGEYTTLVYPASGLREMRLLTLLKKNIFPQLASFHLEDPTYHPDVAVHDPLAGRKVSSGENIVKQFKAAFAGEVNSPPSLHIYDTDYEKTAFDFKSDAGKRIWLDKGPGRDASLRLAAEFYLSTLRRGIVRPGDLVLAVPFAGTDHKKYWHQQIASQVYVPEYYDWTNWDVFRVTEEDFTAAGLPVPARSELRTAVPAVPNPDSLRMLKGRYSVVMDIAAFNALNAEEQKAIYKLFEAYQPGQQVKFIFNAAVPEDRMRMPRALKEFDQRYSNVRVVSMSPEKLSFNDEGRRVISVSREGIKSVFSQFVENKRPAKGLLKVRYGLGENTIGLLPAALLLYETQDPEVWKLAAGGFLTEIPGVFSGAISGFLASYIAIGTSA